MQNFLQDVVSKLVVCELVYDDPKAVLLVAASTEKIKECLVLYTVLTVEYELDDALTLLKLEALLDNVRRELKLAEPDEVACYVLVNLTV